MTIGADELEDRGVELRREMALYDPITAPVPEGDMNGPHGPGVCPETDAIDAMVVLGLQLATEAELRGELARRGLK